LQKVKKLIIASLATIGALVVGVIVATIGSGVAQGWGQPAPSLERDFDPPWPY
jgi:hypothetical protein